MPHTTRQVLKALRKFERIAIVDPAYKDRPHFSVYKNSRTKLPTVINCHVSAILGCGQINHPDFRQVQQQLIREVKDSLDQAQIAYTQGTSIDQFFINGYKV